MKFRYEVTMMPESGSHALCQAWRRTDGKPTDKNLSAYVAKYNDSLGHGVNAHIGSAGRVIKAVIGDRQTNKVVARFVL